MPTREASRCDTSQRGPHHKPSKPPSRSDDMSPIAIASCQRLTGRAGHTSRVESPKSAMGPRAAIDESHSVTRRVPKSRAARLSRSPPLLLLLLAAWAVAAATTCGKKCGSCGDSVVAATFLPRRSVLKGDDDQHQPESSTVSRWVRSMLSLLSPKTASLASPTTTSSSIRTPSTSSSKTSSKSSSSGSKSKGGKVKTTCSKTIQTIPVWTEADFAKRTLFPTTTTVQLNVMTSIALSRGLVFAQNYSCTIVRGAAATPPTLTTLSSEIPLLTVFNASNVLVVGINLIHAVSNNSQSCVNFTMMKDAMDDSGLVCPAVLIVRAWGVQVVKGRVYGRIDVFRSIVVKLDWLTVTMPEVYSKRNAYMGWGTHGIIRVGTNTVGVAMQKSNVVISNCEVYGGWELITLYLGAVGVEVRNNYFHHYYFTSVRCGANAGFVMECHLNTIANNYVESTPGMFMADSAAFYFASHWFSPGNIARCNYVLNGDHCYYLDLHTTGLTIDGGVCLGTKDTVKINAGKYNKVRSLVVVNNPGQQHNLAYTACLWTPTDTCFVGPSRYWNAVRQKWWSTGTIAKVFPWMSTFCPPPTSINGVQCNPNTPGAANYTTTGGCSGLPYLNDVDLITVNSSIGDGSTCDNTTYPAVIPINSHTALNVSRTTVNFIDPVGGDFGLAKKSPLYKARPGFTSCPRSAVGRQPVLETTYFKAFGKLKPVWFDSVLAFDFDAIIDYDVKSQFPW